MDLVWLFCSDPYNEQYVINVKSYILTMMNLNTSYFKKKVYLGDGSVVVDSLFSVSLIVCGCSVFDPCLIIQHFMSF